MDHLKIEAAFGQELAHELCRSVALLAGCTSVSLISPAGSPLCSYPIDTIIGHDLASWVRMAVHQPMLWQGEQALSTLPAGVMPQPEFAAVALVPVTDDAAWGALWLCWRETPAQPLTPEWLASLARFVQAYCERARLERVLQQREERWQALYETTVALTQDLDSAELLQGILQSSILLLDAEGGAILLIDPMRDELIISVASSSKQRSADIVGRRLKRGEGIAWRAIETRRPFVVSNYDAWSGRASAVADKEIAVGAKCSSVGAHRTIWRDQRRQAR